MAERRRATFAQFRSMHRFDALDGLPALSVIAMAYQGICFFETTMLKLKRRFETGDGVKATNWPVGQLLRGRPPASDTNLGCWSHPVRPLRAAVAARVHHRGQD
jgi:hypothetical protein